MPIDEVEKCYATFKFKKAKICGDIRKISLFMKMKWFIGPIKILFA